MEYLQARLRELAERVEKHKRPTPNPAGCTRAANPMGASARSLGNLVGCAEALKEAMATQYSKGIKAGMKAMENAKLDYKNMIDRVAEACKWKAETTDGWVYKGEVACGDLLERAGAALREAEEREEAEAKIWIMETQCEELVNLTTQAGKQVPAEAEAEVLEELEEEMDHREEMVGALGRALKDTVPEGLKDRVEEALKESVAVAAKGRRYVDHVRARLDFSKDSESSSSKAAAGAAPGGWQTAAEELGEELEEEFGEETEEPGRLDGGLETGGEMGGEATGTKGAVPRYLVEFMRSFGQMRANDSGWPTFDGRYVSYPRFKKEWGAYRQTYHSTVSDDLAARTLRDKCLQGDALQMVNHLDDLREMWETLDTCYERPDKYAEEALRPIVDFRKYKIADSAAVREFYSLVRAAIKGARKMGRIELLINDQTIPRIMSKMP
jgi:putative ubiquitin-RnfH superfamily antitoxin RatB of RatAB toxin-antitoxin module